MNKSMYLAISVIYISNILNAAPEVIHLSDWDYGKTGEIVIKHDDGSVHHYNKNTVSQDCKVFPTGSKPWDWRITGTHHNPGIQIADFIEFLDSIDVIILSKGMCEVLQIKPDTIQYLEAWKAQKNGREFHMLRTQDAVSLYNRLAQEGRRVGALLHSTC